MKTETWSINNMISSFLNNWHTTCRKTRSTYLKLSWSTTPAPSDLSSWNLQASANKSFLDLILERSSKSSWLGRISLIPRQTFVPKDSFWSQSAPLKILLFKPTALVETPLSKPTALYMILRVQSDRILLKPQNLTRRSLLIPRILTRRPLSNPLRLTQWSLSNPLSLTKWPPLKPSEFNQTISSQKAFLNLKNS